MQNTPKIQDGFSGERSIVLPEMIRQACGNDEFLSQLYITDIGYYPHAMHHYRERRQGVGQHILIYCVKGSGWCRVDNRHYDVGENQWFIIPQGTPHVYASNNDDPWTIYWIHFTGAMATFFGDNCRQPTAISPGTTSRIADRNNLFEDIFLTLSDNYSTDNLRYASSLLYHFLATFRYLKLFRKHNSKQERIDTTDVVNMAVRFMDENLEKQLTLATIANGFSHFFSLPHDRNTLFLHNTKRKRIWTSSNYTGFTSNTHRLRPTAATAQKTASSSH